MIHKKNQKKLLMKIMDKLRAQKEKELKELEKFAYNYYFDKANLIDTYIQTESRKIN